MIYEYGCYREFLKSELQRRIFQNNQFNAHSFSKKLGLSQSFYSMMMSGQRKLSQNLADQIAEKLNLDSYELKYLKTLVAKENAETENLLNFFKGELNKIKAEAQITDIDLNIFNIISDWKANAVFVCLTNEYFRNNLSEISRNLKISDEELNQAIQKLFAAKLIKNVEGIYLPESNRLNTPSNFKNIALRSFHKSVLKKGIAAIDSQDISKRHVYGSTIAANSKKINEAKQKIENFYSELISFLSDGENVEVYQLSSILFKLESEKDNNGE